MKLNLKNRAYIKNWTLCIALLTGKVIAQNFSHQAVLVGGNKSGYYKVLLSNETKQYANRSLSDIRIYTSDNKEIPYVLVHRSHPLYNKLAKPLWLSLPYNHVISQNTKNKTTIIQFRFKNKQELNRLSFKIKEPKLFLRKALMYSLRSQTVNKKWQTYNEELYQFELNSGDSLRYYFENIYENEITIEIDNRDNPPLQIDTIICEQKPDYLVCELKAGEQYVLKCGSNIDKPDYDLDYFIEKFPVSLPEASLSSFARLSNRTVQNNVKAKTWFETKEFMWLCIGVGAITVLWFTRNLLREMKKSSEEK